MSVGYFGQLQMIILKDNSVDNVVPEGGIATGVLILVLRHKQTLTAADTAVNTGIFIPPILSSEWPLSTAALSDVELLRRQALLQRLLSFARVLCDPALKGLLVLEFSWTTSVLSLEYIMYH